MRNQPVKRGGRRVPANPVHKLWLHPILDAIFPPRCAGCRTWSEEIFCPCCQKNLQMVAAPLCACCGKPFDALAKVSPGSHCADCRDNRYHPAPQLDVRRAPYEYSGPIREAIHSLKYRGKTALAAPLAELLWEYSQSQTQPAIPVEDVSLLVPIPLHPLRRWRRGYNQSTLLARGLSEHTGLPYAELLRRARHTLPQIELDAAHRAANVRDAFEIDSNTLAEYSNLESVLLIDDVATTGATLEECARVLKKAGVDSVYALTLARRDL